MHVALLEQHYLTFSEHQPDGEEADDLACTHYGALANDSTPLTSSDAL